MLPHLVAAFVLFHLAASCLATVPNVASGLDRRAWADPRVRRELAVWAERLGVEQPFLEERLYDVAVSFHASRTSMLAPFEPYLDLAGIRQSWLMFSAGTERSDRFGVRMRRCAPVDPRCDWETLYVHGDDARSWRRAELGHPRVRSMIFRWGWPSYRLQYERGCRAIAQLAFDDFPDAELVECRFEQTVLHSPSNPSPPPPEWGRAVRVRRP